MLRCALALGTWATLVLSGQANGQPADPTGKPSSTQTLGVQIILPPIYEATISSLGALATSGAAAIKTYRSDVRVNVGTQSVHFVSSNRAVDLDARGARGEIK